MSSLPHLLNAKEGLELPHRFRVLENFQPFCPVVHLEIFNSLRRHLTKICYNFFLHYCSSLN
jgi:hypothetical protein